MQIRLRRQDKGEQKASFNLTTKPQVEQLQKEKGARPKTRQKKGTKSTVATKSAKQSTTKCKVQIKHRKNKNPNPKKYQTGDQKQGELCGHHTKHTKQTGQHQREDKDYKHRH